MATKKKPQKKAVRKKAAVKKTKGKTACIKKMCSFTEKDFIRIEKYAGKKCGGNFSLALRLLLNEE